MACRVGITTDPNRRKREWEQNGAVHNWRIVGQNLTKNQAQAMENMIAQRDGCVSSPGGADPDDGSARWWCVYQFDY